MRFMLVRGLKRADAKAESGALAPQLFSRGAHEAVVPRERPAGRHSIVKLTVDRSIAAWEHRANI